MLMQCSNLITPNSYNACKLNSESSPFVFKTSDRLIDSVAMTRFFDLGELSLDRAGQFSLETETLDKKYDKWK